MGRDRVWRAIRRMQEGGPAAADEGEDGLPEGHLPDIFEARRDRAQTGLAALLPDVPPQETLSALLLRAEAACVAEEATVAEHGVRKQAVADTEERLPEHELGDVRFTPIIRGQIPIG